GTLGHVVELRRLAVGSFTEKQAISLDSALALGHSLAASGHLLPIETVLDDIPALALTASEAARLPQGQPVTPQDEGERERAARIAPLIRPRLRPQRSSAPPAAFADCR